MSEAMRPEDVPNDLVLAAAWALADLPDCDEGDGTREVRAMLAAALPLYEQQLRGERDQARAELAALRERLGEPEIQWCYGTTTAAREAGSRDEAHRLANASRSYAFPRKAYYDYGPEDGDEEWQQ